MEWEHPSSPQEDARSPKGGVRMALSWGQPGLPETIKSDWGSQEEGADQQSTSKPTFVICQSKTSW